MGKLIYGVGIYEKGEYKSRIDKNTKSKEYRLWMNMIHRCYSESHQKRRPTYIDCIVSDEFLNFQNFASWCQSQVGFGVTGYHLDKDLLCDGVRRYSRETCCFVPHQINSFIINKGISKTKSKIDKETIARQLATEYRGLVEDRVIYALNNYTVKTGSVTS